MNNSYVANFLHELAKEINRPVQSVDPFIKILEENWFDSKEALDLIDLQQLENLKIPSGLAKMIIEKLNRQKTQQQQPQLQQQLSQQQQPQNNQMQLQVQEQQQQQQYQEIPEKKQPQNQISVEKEVDINKLKDQQIIQQQQKMFEFQVSKLTQILQELKKQTITIQKFIDSCLLVNKIVQNILAEPGNQKFRKLKLSNQQVNEKLGQYLAGQELLMFLNFKQSQENKDEIIMSDEDTFNNINFLKIMIETMQNFAESQNTSFDPYQQIISNTTGEKSISELAKQTQFDPSSFAYKLQDLQQQRRALIQPIQKRTMKVYKVDPQKTNRQVIDQISDEKEYETCDNKLLKQAIQDQLRVFLNESSQFSSKRKKEFETLLKKPLFLQTVIRIRFPDSEILEINFTPLEKIQDLLDLIPNLLQLQNEPFYIYESPPVKKLVGKHAQMTFEELQYVPNCILYFSYENQELNKKLQQFLKAELFQQMQMIQ